MKNYRGSCHCERVRFPETRGAMQCNCSIRTKKGVIKIEINRFDGRHWEEALLAQEAARRGS